MWQIHQDTKHLFRPHYVHTIILYRFFLKLYWNRIFL